MIIFDESTKTFLLQFGEVSYAMRIYGDILLNLWYGARLERINSRRFDGRWVDDLPSVNELTRRQRIGPLLSPAYFGEYTGWEDEMLGNEPAVKAVFSDGTRDLRLRYVSHVIDGERLTIRLGDMQFGFYADLGYTLWDDCSTMERQVTLVNEGDSEVTLEAFMSASLHLPQRESLRLTTLTGKWADEYRISREKIRDGQTVLQTRSIFSGADSAPFFAIDEGDADERRGSVWYAHLHWSGTHKIVVEKESMGSVSVLMGINPFDCRLTLKPGESHTLPICSVGYTEGGFGGMTRATHAYERRHVMMPVEAERVMPVVANAYGTFFSNINEEKIMSLIEPAHEAGVEALIIDAGWAGESDNYQLGMGVWNENKERFPQGLRSIADALHERKMLFGLWMEPEVVHIDSPLYREHPDWVFGYPSREADVKGKFRLALNLGLDEVRAYLTDKIEFLIESCKVDYFKIDYNRHLWETGSVRANRRDFWAKYVDNLCGMYQEIKERHPDLLFENCAGGGQRVDLGMLRFSGRINRSDNQDPLDILKIHEGFSYIMLPKLAGGGCHISDVYTRHFNNRVTPMRYQAHIAMMGSLAIGKNLVESPKEELEELKAMINDYKTFRRTVHLGDFYRLASAYDKPYASFEYLSPEKDEAIVFVLGQSIQFIHIHENLRLDGLDEDALYDVAGYGIRSGRSLMKIGLRVTLEGDFDSKIIKLKKVKQ